MIAGIDFSTRAVDVVLLDEDSDAATWHRFELEGEDAFARARWVRHVVPGPYATFWDDVLAVGIEDPRGYNAGSLYRIQGAVLACMRRETLVHPLIPSHWRKTVGLPGNAPKKAIAEFVRDRFPRGPFSFTGSYEPAITSWGEVLVPARSSEYSEPYWWPQDACDAYCIALATRIQLRHGEQAA